ncbi:MAG: hypothetical protein AAB512_03605 [Patescibacteria group bacterium]
MVREFDTGSIEQFVGQKASREVIAPVVGGSGDEPRVSKSTMRRKVIKHEELHKTIVAIREFDASGSLPLGRSRSFRSINRG